MTSCLFPRNIYPPVPCCLTSVYQVCVLHYKDHLLISPISSLGKLLGQMHQPNQLTRGPNQDTKMSMYAYQMRPYPIGAAARPLGPVGVYWGHWSVEWGPMYLTIVKYV